MKTIEFMFPELSNVFADSYNMEYLAKCCNDIEILETRYTEVPRFASQDVDMIYFGCTTETGQEKALDMLRQYKDRLAELIEKGTIILVTGNAIEDFGKYIDCGNDKRIEGLGLFDFYSERYMDQERHNSQFIARFEDGEEELEIIGHKSQFSFSYGDFEDDYFLKLVDGVGMHKGCMLEGIRKNNFYATYSLGPFLVFNPGFTKYLLRLLGVDDSLCFEKEANELHDYRLRELYERIGR